MSVLKAAIRLTPNAFLPLLSARTFTTISKSSPLFRRWCFSVKAKCLFWFCYHNKAFSRKIWNFFSILDFGWFFCVKKNFFCRKLCLKIESTNMTLMPHVRHIATHAANQKLCLESRDCMTWLLNVPIGRWPNEHLKNFGIASWRFSG